MIGTQLDLFDDYDFYNSYSFDHLQVLNLK